MLINRKPFSKRALKRMSLVFLMLASSASPFSSILSHIHIRMEESKRERCK